MSSTQPSAAYSAPEGAEIKNFNPAETPGASPPKNLKDFAEKRLVIYEAEISPGKDYDMAKMVVTVDESTERVVVSSYSGFIIAAVRDMIARQHLPCQVRLATSGKALYFKGA